MERISFDRTANGGGLLMYIREHIPSRAVKIKPHSQSLECIFVELNLYKKKWLIGGAYNPCKTMLSGFLTTLGSCLDQCLPIYDNFIVRGDFNAESTNMEVANFCAMYNLKNLVKEATCYKNVKNPSCIDLILTNRHKPFHKTKVLETGIPDFHLMAITVLKTYFKKATPSIVTYHDYKNYSHANFRMELRQTLSLLESPTMSNDEYVNVFTNIFDKHAPLKQKYLRANHGPFVTKDLRKACMLRSRLRNKFIETKTRPAEVAYKKQRNICTQICRKAKKDYYGNLKTSSIMDNKTFWRTAKPLFSDKVR